MVGETTVFMVFNINAYHFHFLFVPLMILMILLSFVSIDTCVCEIYANITYCAVYSAYVTDILTSSRYEVFFVETVRQVKLLTLYML